MSRCFPFPPPGYETKARAGGISLISKEKHKKKKHKDDDSSKKHRNKRKKKGKHSSSEENQNGQKLQHCNGILDYNRNGDRLADENNRVMEGKPAKLLPAVDAGSNIKNNTVYSRMANGKGFESDLPRNRGSSVEFETVSSQVNTVKERPEEEQNKLRNNTRKEDGHNSKELDKNPTAEAKAEMIKLRASNGSLPSSCDNSNTDLLKGQLSCRNNWSKPSLCNGCVLSGVGRITEPGRTSNGRTTNGSDTKQAVDSRDSKQYQMNGKPGTSSRPASNSEENKLRTVSSTKPRHPDSKYLSRILTVPQVEWLKFDDQEWVLGRNHSSAKRPKLAASKEVWAGVLQIESADVAAMPYVIPY